MDIWQYSNEIWTFVIVLFSIITKAVGDGWRDRWRYGEGKRWQRNWNHAMVASSYGILLLSPMLLSIDWRQGAIYLGTYLLIRAAIFDPVYNVARGVHWRYVPDYPTNLWDWVLLHFKGQHIFVFRIVAFLAGGSLPINFY